MKYLKPFVFLALLVSFGCQRSIQNGLRYRLSYDAAEQKIQVEMQYMPASNDSMTFVYGNPGFGGQQDIFNCVRDLTVFGKHKVIDSLRQVTVYPEGKKPIDIHYSIVDDGAKGNPNVSVEEFIQTTAQYLPGNEIKKYTDNYIMQGQLIDFSTVPLSKEFSVSMEEGVPVVSVMDKAY